MNLILLDPRDFRDAGAVTLTGAHARHAIEVLKVIPGETLRVGVVDGACGIATVVAVAGGGVELRCAFETEVPQPPAVDLLLALPRPKVMRRLWAQLAALGVGRIILTNAARVERNYFDTHVLAEAGYRPLLIEGLQQARETWLPRVSIHRQLKVLVEDELDGMFPHGVRLLAHPGDGQAPQSLLRDHPGGRVLLAVGPEGGWNAFELTLFETHGFQPVAMGTRTLRTDTACIALLALVHDALASG